MVVWNNVDKYMFIVFLQKGEKELVLNTLLLFPFYLLR